MSLDEIRDFYALSERVGTAGQPTADQFEAVRAGGYEVVINLAPYRRESAALPDEAQIVAGLGMEYVHIPVDWESPRREDAEAFFRAMREHADKRVFVHCIANRRVSAFVYLYRTLCEKVPEPEAARDLNRLWTPEGVWGRFIAETTADPIRVERTVE